MVPNCSIGIRYLPPKTPPATKLPDAGISPDSWRTKLKKVETKHEEITPAADEPTDEIKTPRLKTLRVSIVRVVFIIPV